MNTLSRTNSRLAPSPLGARFAAAIFAMLAVVSSADAQIGLSQFTLDGIPVTLTYPTTAPSSVQQLGPFTLSVAMNAPLPETASSRGKHRLIVISHGTGGAVFPDQDLAQALAKAGFVVAQPLHAGDNHTDSSEAGPRAFERRPTEVIRVIDGLAQHPQWSKVLDLSKVGVHGMSAGGVTGLSLAGGQWRTLNLVRHCNRVGDDDIGFCLQGAKTEEQRKARLARYSSAKNVPEFLLPQEIKVIHGGRQDGQDRRPDSRVAAVSLSVPVAAIFSEESLKKVSIPVGIVVADRDEVLLPRYHAEFVLTHVPKAERLITMEGAGHFDVLSPWPESVAEAVAKDQIRGGAPRLGTGSEQRRLMRDKVVAFHVRHLGRSDTR